MTINYSNGDKTFPVFVSDYVKAKTKDLIEFGYNNLAEKEVLQALYDILILNKKSVTVIHGFIKDEVSLQ